MSAYELKYNKERFKEIKQNYEDIQNLPIKKIEDMKLLEKERYKYKFNQ